MRIGIDTRLQNETGVGRYIRNLIHYLPILDKKNTYIFINSSIPWHSVEEQYRLPRLLQSKKLDLVHFPYFSVPLLDSGKFVVTIHDLIINSFDTGRASTHNALLYNLKRIGYDIVMKNAVSKSHAIIVPSNAVKSELLKYYPFIQQAKISVTYEGVDQKIFRSDSLSVSPLSDSLSGKSYFLYVGNVYPHKNVELLISAFSQLHDKSVLLVLVGKMDYFHFRILELVKKFNLESQVILTGLVADYELAYLYQNAQATVLPSLMEGFGLPALEAMHNNCLVLASDILVFREICEDSAVYFDPKSEISLITALKSVLAYDPKLSIKEKIIRGRNRSTDFSWKKMVKETIKIYEKALRA